MAWARLLPLRVILSCFFLAYVFPIALNMCSVNNESAIKLNLTSLKIFFIIGLRDTWPLGFSLDEKPKRSFRFFSGFYVNPKVMAVVDFKYFFLEHST